MSRFAQTQKLYEENDAENSAFFKLEDGEKAVVAFLGDPFNKQVYYDGNRYVPWTKECGKQATIRTMMNVARMVADEEGAFSVQAVQILDQSKTFFKKVIQLDNKYGLDKQLIEIRREGTKKDTEWHLLPECAITSDLKKELAGLTLWDLAASDDSEEGPVKADAASQVRAAEDPKKVISQAEGNELIAGLKTLKDYKPEIVGDFLEQFQVSKVRELIESQLREARTWVQTELEAMRRSQNDEGAAGAAHEEDPFA